MSSLRQTIRSLPKEFWIIFVGSFINRFGTFVVPFLILYLTSRGYSLDRAGFAVGAYGIGHLVASVAGGFLADRLGRKQTIVLSMFTSAAVLLTLSQLENYWAIVVTTFLAGASAELYRPASAALMTDLVPEEDRVVAFGLYRFAINLGFAAGPATAGLLAEKGYLWLFVGDAITSAGYGLLAMLALPAIRRYPRKVESGGEATRAILADRLFVLFLIATACITFVDFQMGSTMALHVRDAGFPPSSYGLLISINGILIVLFEVPLTAWTRGLNHRKVIAAGYFLQGLGFALTGLASSFTALAFTVVVWTVGEMIFAPVSGAYVANIAAPHLRGRYMGVWTGMWSFGMTLGPSLGTMIYARRPPLIWILCGVLGIISTILVLVPVRRRSEAAR